MNKRKYVRPEMTEILVELEKGFLKASVIGKDEKDDATINKQEDGGSFDLGWDSPETTPQN